ncbi:hypothetical protein Tco_0197622 [Tanacetum coccineum]
MWCQRMPQQMWCRSVSDVVPHFADVAALFENGTSVPSTLNHYLHFLRLFDNHLMGHSELPFESVRDRCLFDKFSFAFESFQLALNGIAPNDLLIHSATCVVLHSLFQLSQNA